MTDLSKPSKEDENETSRKANQLPKPQGYKILIALPEPEEKTEGGTWPRHLQRSSTIPVWRFL